jgi:hypothetical protein
MLLRYAASVKEENNFSYLLLGQKKTAVVAVGIIYSFDM